MRKKQRQHQDVPKKIGKESRASDVAGIKDQQEAKGQRAKGPKRERQRNREKLSELISRSNRQADDLGKSKGKENRLKSHPAPPINASAARAKLDSLTHPESPLPKNYAALKVQPPRAKSNKPNAGQRKGQTPLSVRTHFSAY